MFRAMQPSRIIQSVLVIPTGSQQRRRKTALRVRPFHFRFKTIDENVIELLLFYEPSKLFMRLTKHLIILFAFTIIYQISDKLKTQRTGVNSQGDAAFADYTINLDVAFSFR